jgi:hypothetical protein
LLWPGKDSGNAAVTEFLQCSASSNTAGSPPRPSAPANAAPLEVMTMARVRQNDLVCGRYVMSKATGDLLSYFDAEEGEGTPPPPSWNVAPTQDVPIVAERLDEGSIERHLLVAHWGLVPSWAKDVKIGNKLLSTS